MSPEMIGLVGLIMLLVLVFMNIWVGAALALTGFLGVSYLAGWDKALLMMGMEPYAQAATWPIAALPLFLLMGALVSTMGIGEDLYKVATSWLGWIRGGLAMATVAACGLFAAICGDSIATAATMGKVAYPEMRRFNYDPKLAVAAISAGGTIGILIPPSVGFILYGLLTEQSIGKLFIAGIIPGILEAVFYIITIFIICWINPQLGPPAPRVAFKDKLASLKYVWPVIVIFLTIIFGIYGGVFTPTEAGAIGALGVLAVSFLLRRFKWQDFRGAVAETATSTSMVVFLLVGAFILVRFIAMSGLSDMLGDFITGLALPRLVILIVILAFYIFIGCFLNMITVIVITVPIVYPIILGLGYDPIWWGVITVRMIEMGMITPPIGINIFVLSKITNVPIGSIYRGIVPFVLADIAHVALLVAFPELSLFLVELMR